MPLDDAARAELEEIFLADAHVRLDRLAALLEALAADPGAGREEADREAHSIRGSAAMTGHGDLAALCVSVEQLLEEDDPEGDELLAAARLLRQARGRLRAPVAAAPRFRDRLLPRRVTTQLGLILVLAIVPAIGLAVYDVVTGRAGARARIKADAMGDAALAGAAQAQVLAGGRSVLGALAETPELRGGDLRACRTLLARYAVGFAPLVGLWVADGGGRVRCASSPLPPGGISVAALPVFRQVRATRRFAVGPLERDARHGRVIGIAEPLGTGGRVLGAEIAQSSLQAVVDDARLPRGGAISLFDRDGTVLARRPAAARYVGRNVPVSSIPGLRGAVARGIDGTTRMYAVARAGPWYVSVGIPTSAEYGRLTHEFEREALIVGGLGLLGFGLALVGVRRSLALPLRRLVETTRRLGQGELSARTGVTGRGGELDELAAAVDATASALERTMRERENALRQLGRHATDLEERVSERTVDLQEARRAADRSNEAKSAFLSRLSHELRTPLNGIRGFAALLAGSDLTPEDTDAARHISAAAEHMTMLVEELLDVARIEAGQFRVELAAVPVSPVIEGVVSLAGGAAREHEVTLTSAAQNAALRVAADAQRLRQALTNLVNNAIAYNRPGGEVVVTVEPGPEGRVVVSVTDTGVGIAAEDLGRVFEPYDRLGRGAESSGLGLGLALSKRLVEAMGGAIGVESRPGVGSRFWIELLDADHLRDIEVQRAAANGAGAGKVLHVDDDPTSRRLIERVLAGRGVDVVEAATGEEGLELARSAKPDLVLLDMRLPDASGLEVLEAMRHDESLRAVPIVMLSGAVDRDTIRRLLEAGADDYLTKPLELERAHELFDRLLVGRRDR